MASLQAEQYQLCCYSELRADEVELGYHIEHVENKRQNPSRTFEYQNLAASALHAHDLQTLPEQRFGGHAVGKQQACDMARFISPHQADCRRFFAYLSNGNIEPAHHLNQIDKDRAEYTIGILNLNSPHLISLRRAWWAELDQLIGEHLDNDWSLVHLAAVDLCPCNGKLSRFFSLTRQLLGPKAEHALQTQAPQLV
jgi:uncharacterized protein (TIGR02646 family)